MRLKCLAMEFGSLFLWLGVKMTMEEFGVYVYLCRRNAQAKVMMPVGDRVGWAVLGEWSGEKPRTKMAATCACVP